MSVTGKLSDVARDYFEVFTDSFGPTLRGDSLRIDAPDVFFSANTDLGSLTINAPNSLTFYFADVRAEQMDLSSDGDVSLIGFDDVAEADLVRPALASVATEPFKVGQSAAKKALRFVSNVDQFLTHKFQLRMRIWIE